MPETAGEVEEIESPRRLRRGPVMVYKQTDEVEVKYEDDEAEGRQVGEVWMGLCR